MEWMVRRGPLVLLILFGGFGLAKDPGDERLKALTVAVTDELANLDGKDFGGVHLVV